MIKYKSKSYLELPSKFSETKSNNEKNRVIVLVLRYCRISAQSIELLPKAPREYLGALVFLKLGTSEFCCRNTPMRVPITYSKYTNSQSYPSSSTIAAARLRIASAPSTQ